MRIDMPTPSLVGMHQNCCVGLCFVYVYVLHSNAAFSAQRGESPHSGGSLLPEAPNAIGEGALVEVLVEASRN